MANSFSKIYLHIVFAVKGRESFINPMIRQRVYMYMTGVVKNFGHKLLAIGGIENHVHLLIEYNPNQPLPLFVKELKTATTKMINEKHLIPFKFAWQRGYGCFSYSASQVEAVRNYILNQYEHHKNQSFKDELIKILERYGVEYDDAYLFTEE